MKRYFPLILILMAGWGQPAFADAVSDAFNAGSGYASSNKNQGTSAATGTDPSALIPGYTASPSQSGYYGGVQGSDGGLASQGQTALSQSEAGQAINDSSTKNPAVTIDPTADFIQNGKNAEANSGSITSGTNTQCSSTTVSKSVFENYSCDRDVNQVQTCARTATPTLSYSTETHDSTITFTLNNGTSNGTVVTYQVVATSSGVISSGTVSYTQPASPTNHSGWAAIISGFGQTATLYRNNSASFNVTPQTINKGDTLTFTVGSNATGHVGDFVAGIATATQAGTEVITLTFPIQETVTTATPGISWSTSCGFDQSTAIASDGSVCTEEGGTRTVTGTDGQSYQVSSDCWQYSDAYIVPVSSTGNCSTLIADRNCTLSARSCSEAEGSTCLHEADTYQCQTSYSSEGLLCGGQYFCQGGDCSETDGAGDSGFDTAVAKLAGLASAGEDVKNDQINVKAFTGQAIYCRKAMAGFNNCCVDSGWGNSVGLANCSSDEKALGVAREKKVTVYVGEACNISVMGVCVQKKQAYCVFQGKLARIIQEQGRRDQLHVSFGSGDTPDCRGITVPELQAINFDLINFQDFYSDLIANQKIPDSSTMVQQVKDRIAAQVAAQTGGK